MPTHRALGACAGAHLHCTRRSRPCCSHGHAARTQSLCQGSQAGRWCPSPLPAAASGWGPAGPAHPCAGTQWCSARQVVSGGAAASTGRSISPRSGLSGRDGGLGTWVGELGTGRGCARGGHTCWDGAGWRLGGSNKSQAVGVAVVWRNVGSVKELCGLIFRVAGERDNSKGSHLHFPPSVTQAKTPSLQVSVSFLPNTPFPTSFLHKAFSLQYLLHPHLFSTS